MIVQKQYQTRQHRAISAVFEDNPSACLTAAEVAAVLARNDFQIGMATIYRTLARMCDDGTLRRFQPDEDGQPARYQSCQCREEHLHIRCTECGELCHLQCDELRAFSQHLLNSHGFTLREDKSMLYGVCENCRRREAKS